MTRPIAIPTMSNPWDISTCPNCNEPVGETCACIRNTCVDCGGPVGNVTFTVCDSCWNKDLEQRNRRWLNTVNLPDPPWKRTGTLLPTKAKPGGLLKLNPALIA